MKKILAYIIKILTHEYCDSCGYTKDEVYVTWVGAGGGICECQKCIDKNYP